MIDNVKDQMTWLFNQEDARKIIEIINPREFTVVEAVLCENGKSEVVAENTKMVQWEGRDAVDNMLDWFAVINRRFNHYPGERYIYFRFKRFN